MSVSFFLCHIYTKKPQRQPKWMSTPYTHKHKLVTSQHLEHAKQSNLIANHEPLQRSAWRQVEENSAALICSLHHASWIMIVHWGCYGTRRGHVPRPDCWMRETRVKLLWTSATSKSFVLLWLSDWGWERPCPDHVGILDSIPSWDSEHSVTTKACFLLGSKQKQELLSSSDPIKWQSVSRKYWQTFWHFISHIFRHVYLPFYLSFYPAFYLTHTHIYIFFHVIPL